jgi:hypothetical protein
MLMKDDGFGGLEKHMKIPDGHKPQILGHLKRACVDQKAYARTGIML